MQCHNRQATQRNKKMDIEQKQLRNRSQSPEWERPWVKKRERERGGLCNALQNLHFNTFFYIAKNCLTHSLKAKWHYVIYLQIQLHTHPLFSSPSSSVLVKIGRITYKTDKSWQSMERVIYVICHFTWHFPTLLAVCVYVCTHRCVRMHAPHICWG